MPKTYNHNPQQKKASTTYQFKVNFCESNFRPYKTGVFLKLKGLLNWFRRKV